MKILTTASEYPYAYVVGQKVRYKPLLSSRMVEAYIIKLPDDNNAVIRTRQGKELKIKLEKLFADASLWPGQPYIPLTMPWREWMLQRVPLRKIDSFLCEAIWTYVNATVFNRRMVRPEIFIRRLEGFTVGRFYIQRDNPASGYIVIDPAARVGLNGLASVIAHEAMHQWQARARRIVDHDAYFSSLIPKVAAATGIKVVIRGDDTSDAEFELGLNPIEADKDQFYLFVKDPAVREWKAGSTSNVAIAWDALDSFAHDPNLEIRLYRGRDLALVKLTHNFDDQVARGDTVYMVDYAPEMLLDYAVEHCELVKTRPSLTLSVR